VLGVLGIGERIREDELSPAKGDPRKGHLRLALAVALGFLVVAGALGVQAFTLIPPTAYEDAVSPAQGTATSSFVVEGGLIWTACPTPPIFYVFNFYFDKSTGGPQIWTTQTNVCVNGKQDTGPSPALVPPAAFASSGAHTIELDVIDPQRGSIAGTATRPYTIAATLADDPTCGSPASAVTLTGTGWRPDTTVTITFEPPAGGKPIASAVPNQGGAFQTIVAVPNVKAGSYAFVATQNFVGALGGASLTARVPFLVPCVKAVIVLKPTVGPPGTVVTVIGTGFPVGGVVKLSWNFGIKLSLPSITIGATQGFRVVVLIFPHDQLGPRVMSASPDLTVPTAPLFNIATAKFLVVPGSEQPRDFSWRN
jgi:hypothetical protein